MAVETVQANMTADGRVRVFARNCEVRPVDARTASLFWTTHHPLGSVSCDYRYGLYVCREGHASLPPGTLVAVSGFSGPRRWDKGGRQIRSYEWVRHASLDGVQVIGGMGKALQAFVRETDPDDIMSYADLSRSQGAVYARLGFVREGTKTFPGGAASAKYRLKRVVYE